MKKIALGMAAAMVVATSPAYAAPLLFNFSGPSGTAIFQLDSNPTPDFSQTFIGSDQFSFSNVAGTFAGIAGTASTVSFGNGIFSSLSIAATNLGFTQFNSPTLFTGSPSNPIFLTGSFTLVNPFFGDGTLTISPAAVAGAVPEPATWAMMLVGFGGIGFSMRRRLKVRTTVSYT
ncbi:PEPxxWA-CTERM sorting domain-containing protein [Sphingomonas endolithica]|uniref:PEPxxWA-CTERM sorting domain-containing protein n=1 Tax=Sphingomonas endolithica TaxID=2972485 RepID=UPI0021AE7FFE|nr:PEPxxWA-CTERM sorting domain-containing protein [Sphingomonas sp. ZFBP2030]